MTGRSGHRGGRIALPETTRKPVDKPEFENWLVLAHTAVLSGGDQMKIRPNFKFNAFNNDASLS
jgi:hypothetical protein